MKKKIKNTIVNMMAALAICAGGIASAFEAPKPAATQHQVEEQYVNLDIVQF